MMQIIKFLKFQVGIISPGALFCKSSQDEESNGSMTAEIISSSKTSDMSDHEFVKYAANRIKACHWTIYQELCQLRRRMARLVCHIVLDTKSVEITNPKT